MGFNEQRVLRTPVSETVTQLPDEVTRITRNIDTHMPMVHERIRNHYAVENINKKNVIHHYISPVRNERMGTRKGRAFKQQTEHVVHTRPSTTCLWKVKLYKLPISICKRIGGNSDQCYYFSI